MSEAEFLAKVAEIGRISAPPPDEAPIRPAEWDSVAVLDLIAAIDDAFGVTIPTTAIHSCSTVGELRGVVRTAVENG